MSFEEWMQSRLTAHRFPVGAIDGVIGDRTIAAIKSFQVSKGLEPTGRADPATVKALREPSSLVSLDVAAAIPDRSQAAPEAFQPSATQWPRQSECFAFYGAVGTHQTTIEIPFDFYLAWSKSTRVSKISVHEKVAASASRVFHRIAEIYTAGERHDLGLDLFGGSLNVRRMRGGSAYSMHSWGIAIDFDPERNQLAWGKDRARLAQPDAVPFWVAWESEGWLSLGRAKNFDWMHVQAARL